MIEYHAYIVGPDGKITSRHSLFCNEAARLWLKPPGC